ncbi:MAG TPA: transporter substrate-binding domain-containing protein [Jatrophihabitantaceae bacterium]|nr:transporter substrate-binding domain-containing protein [Jatrophihabitantaceae bacterium]
MTSERFPAETTKIRRRGSSSRRGRWLILIGAAAVTALVAGCSAGSTPTLPTVAPPSTSSAPPASTPPARPGCDDKNNTRVESYDPSTVTTGPALERIKRAGKLKVGVSADNLLFGYRNPIKGTLEGFDIDMVNEVAKAIFGSAQGRVQYVVENFAQRIPDLQAGRVDLVADIMTINCIRWNQIAFSAEYFHAGQQILVRRNSYNSIKQMNGKKVCTGAGSTGFDNLVKNYKQVQRVVVNDISDCMVLFQQGAVEGVISDNTVVQGFAAQDPYAVVLPDLLSPEPYGLGFSKTDVDFVRFVNALLEQMRADGDWQRIHNKWVPTDKNAQPQPVYGRALP